MGTGNVLIQFNSLIFPAGGKQRPNPEGSTGFAAGFTAPSQGCEIPAWSCQNLLHTGIRNLFNIQGADLWIQGDQTQGWSNSGASSEHPRNIPRIPRVSLEHLLNIPGASPKHPQIVPGASLEHPWNISRTSSE